MTELPKTYDAARVEAHWTPIWEADAIFQAGNRPDAEPWTCMIPPPNVTSFLHMGHALNGVVQDVLSRWHRMRGRDVLWLPGTDHAGIATQAVVEKKLYEEQKVTREEMGRDAFVGKVWEWKEDYGNQILQQFRQLGCSCDWTRTAFTMDENLTRAVRASFVKLWQKGLIYRGTRMVNWDCKLQSAIGDDEIEEVERKGQLWHLRYPLEDGSGHLVVATTRPETMLGDTGVAVHPDDDRYRAIVGKNVVLPLVDRPIPIVADDTVEPEFGTGAVKVTPGHDFNDYERGHRHDLPIINILNKDGTLNEHAGAYAELTREKARKKVVADLDALGLLEKIEDYDLRLPLSDRSKTPIEPLVSEQWFVKMKNLANPAIAAVKDGTLEFRPERWTKVYLAWLENVRDWCISRQLWWGHQIPVWYDEDDVPVASETDLAIGDPHPETGKPIVRRDADVLDTWASSWLWPFSTLGWPADTSDLARYYPTQFLSTAREIIYLWVARMVMAGYEFLGKCPFDTVYIHATVLDGQGRRMSKSAGNGIDPRDMIGQYGADATRFTLAMLTTEGQDVKLAPTKFELGRNFMNKIWNSARFVLGSVPNHAEARSAEPGRTLTDRWIQSRLAATTESVTTSLENYRFHDATQALYHFVWDDFCDWYVEASKERLRAGDLGCGATLLSVLEGIVRLLQPFAPFIAAELHVALGGDGHAALLEWPAAGARDPEAEAHMTRIQDTVRAIRKLRNENRVPPTTDVDASIRTEDPQPLLAQEALIRRLARLSTIAAGPAVARPAAGVTEVLGQDEVYLSLEGLIDVEAERGRKKKELEKAEGYLAGIEKKLANENFVQRAKPEVVQRERERAGEAREMVARIREALENL
ncbi:MAG: valine--tRNA ligase [Planctomycetota bacterium]|jgi:valyl-tRNA synthetase